MMKANKSTMQYETIDQTFDKSMSQFVASKQIIRDKACLAIFHHFIKQHKHIQSMICKSSFQMQLETLAVTQQNLIISIFESEEEEIKQIHKKKEEPFYEDP